MENIAIGVWLVLCGATLIGGWYPLVKGHRAAARAARASGAPPARWFPHGRQQRNFVCVGSLLIGEALDQGVRAITTVAETTDLLHVLSGLILVVASLGLLVGSGLVIVSQRTKLLDRAQQNPPPTQ